VSKENFVKLAVVCIRNKSQSKSVGRAVLKSFQDRFPDLTQYPFKKYLFQGSFLPSDVEDFFSIRGKGLVLGLFSHGVMYVLKRCCSAALFCYAIKKVVLNKNRRPDLKLGKIKTLLVRFHGLPQTPLP